MVQKEMYVMKIASRFLLAATIASSSGAGYTFPGSVPSIFEKDDGMNTMKLFQNDSYGYGYYGIQIYSTPFAKNDVVHSRLFLVHTIVDFTPGYAAYKNDEKEFLSNSYLKSGYLHLSFFEYEDEDRMARSSSFYLKDMLPRSSAIKKTITSSTGTDYSF